MEIKLSQVSFSPFFPQSVPSRIRSYMKLPDLRSKFTLNLAEHSPGKQKWKPKQSLATNYKTLSALNQTGLKSNCTGNSISIHACLGKTKENNEYVKSKCDGYVCVERINE